MSHYNAKKYKMMRSHCAPERLVANLYLHCARSRKTHTHSRWCISFMSSGPKTLQIITPVFSSNHWLVGCVQD